ncbi:MAG: DEAD/DEAH box helicase [Propionibacteriaceae bacterium]|jgi:ATP-dependent RNA helicase DeaD|nr:DEAD/DEAH box helicase [Propionibacteriaceae bacterium]
MSNQPDRDAPVTDPAEQPSAFADLGLPESLVATVAKLGFQQPTPIQQAAIPALLERRDVIGLARTGTGKTAAFGLPMLTLIDVAQPVTQALVLAPTRELALQTTTALTDLGQSLAWPAASDRGDADSAGRSDQSASQSRPPKSGRGSHGPRFRDVPPSGGLNIITLYGGAPYRPQLHGLAAGAHIVVGTPGRIVDHLNRGSLVLDNLVLAVIDEADDMLQMGFADDLEQVFSRLPADCQRALFSATMPPPIRRLARSHLKNPVELSASVDGPATVAQVTQQHAIVPDRLKLPALIRFLAGRTADAVIVFVRTKAAVEQVSVGLIEAGVNAAGLSGDVAQAERERVVARVRAGQVDVLVATDVAARGLDIDRIGLVINYDWPRETESYVHRIGRTGRAGRAGQALSFVTPQERGRLRRVEQVIGATIDQVAVPLAAEVRQLQLGRLLDQAQQRWDQGVDPALVTMIEGLSDQVEPAALAAALLAWELDRAVAVDPAHEAEIDRELQTARHRRPAAERQPRDRGSRSDRSRFDRPRHDGDGHSGRSRSDQWEGQSKRRPDRGRGSGQPMRYWVGVGRADGVSPGAIVGAITGESGLPGRDLGRIDIHERYSLVEISHPLSGPVARQLAKTQVAGRALRIRPDRG